MESNNKLSISVLAVYAGDDCPTTKIPANSSLIAKYKVIPIKILLKDGAKIIIDRVTNIQRQASSKVGGLGECYTCLATMGDRQREIYVYKDENDWYMESDF